MFLIRFKLYPLSSTDNPKLAGNTSKLRCDLCDTPRWVPADVIGTDCFLKTK